MPTSCTMNSSTANSHGHDHVPPANELHLLYVLLDSNLPTGGFVSSSGLEAYAKHGFLAAQVFPSSNANTDTQFKAGQTGMSGPPKVRAPNGVLAFSQAEVENYAATTLAFVADSWRVTDTAISGSKCCAIPHKAQDTHHVDTTPMLVSSEEAAETAMGLVCRLDEYHEATLLSHVSRRSSRAQGVAMLTLYSRGLNRPSDMPSFLDAQPKQDLHMDDATERREEIGNLVVEQYRRSVRRGDLPGHLATCWGVITAALGLSLDRSLHLHLFLHARSLLSSSVRLNILGPYASSQLLLHPFATLISETLSRHPDPTTGLISCLCHSQPEIPPPNDLWGWTDYGACGPATTWPLGEIIMARHDLQHSRIFNS